MNNIFISSSFRDMQHERDAIRYYALPKINEYLRENYGQETNIVDLRWGIDTSAADEETSTDKIVRTCLYEIDNCRPFMIVLIGDRYGTYVNPKKNITNFDDGNHPAISVTELEVRHAMHLARQRKMHIYFYFRDMDYSDMEELEKSSVFFDVENKEEKLMKLCSLKNEIIKMFPCYCRTYPASWNAQKNNLNGADKLVDMIFADIKTCISQELGEPHKALASIDDAFSKSKQLSFVGRENELSQIKKFLDTDKTDIAVVYGAMGAGKSSLIANLPKMLDQEKYECINVFCGQSYSSDSAVGVVRSIVTRLYNLLKIPKENNAASLRSFNQWHKEMDRLIDLHVARSKKTLVIAIDAIDQMIQDIDTKKLLFLPYTHESKVKIILSAVDDYTVETSLPLLEHMTQIFLDSPSETEIKQVIDDVWVKYGKPSVSEKIKAALLQKPMSGNYLYVNLVLAKLTLIGNEVFGSKNNNETYIIDSIIETIEKFPDTLEKAADELLCTAGNIINPNMSQKVFNFLRLSEHGLRVTDLYDLCGNSFVAADFSCLKQLLGVFLFERGDHRFDFTHKVFRIGNSIFSGDECSDYLNYAISLPQNDPMSVEYKVHAAIAAHKTEMIWKWIYEALSSSELEASISEQLVRVIEKDAGAVDELLCEFPEALAPWGYLSFFADYLIDHIAQSKNAKKIIDGISDRVYKRISLDALTGQELDVLTVFEEKHFRFDYDYYGGCRCDTNRYYKCLCELEKRNPTIENRIKTASFRLDYEMFWDRLRERYDFAADIGFETACIIGDILGKFKNEKSVGAVLLVAKTFIKIAEAKFERVVTSANKDIPAYVPDNHAMKLYISRALQLIHKVSTRQMLRFDKTFRAEIARCYYGAGNILIKTSSEGNVYSAFLAEEANAQAFKYLEKAYDMCLKDYRQTKNFDDTLSLLADILCAESEIICKGYCSKNRQVKTVKTGIDNLTRYIEKQMYLVLQSQRLCSQFARLCAIRSDVIRGSLPSLDNVYDADEYPWSRVFSKEENYNLHHELERMNYWADRAVSLYKYLFSINPNPAYTNSYIVSLKNRMYMMKYYKYRSLRAINNAIEQNIDGFYDIIVVNKKDKELDEQEQNRREFSVLLDLCCALLSAEYKSKDVSTGLFCLAASEIFSMYPCLSSDCLEKHKERVLFVENAYAKAVLDAAEDTESFAYYALKEYGYTSFESMVSFNSEFTKEAERKYKKVKNGCQNTSIHCSYEKLFYDWYEILC